MNQGPRWAQLIEKKQRAKISCYCPFKNVLLQNFEVKI
jgi:hypothetical protein